MNLKNFHVLQKNRKQVKKTLNEKEKDIYECLMYEAK